MNAEYTLEIRSGSDAPQQLRDQFAKLVLLGGEVGAASLSGLIAKARILGVVRRGSDYVATAAIKRPNPAYREKVFVKAGLSDPGRYSYELGWVFVDEAHRGRGLSKRLVGALLGDLDPAGAYATSLTTNAAMHKVLLVHGFLTAGDTYPATRKNQRLQAFLRAPKMTR